MKIVGASVKEFNPVKELSNTANKNMQECMRLLKLAGHTAESAKALLPAGSRYTVSWEFVDSCTEMANIIRRCILAEVPVLSMDYDEFKDFHCTDPFVTHEFLKAQIGQVPIFQEEGKWNIELKNDTEEPIMITAKHIDERLPFIPLCPLSPGTELIVNNIHTVEGMGRDDAGLFQMVDSFTYFITDHKSSLTQDYKNIKYGYTTYFNMKDPFYPIAQCCRVLIERLEQIAEDLENIAGESYFSDLIQIETKGEVVSILFKGEYWGMCRLISKYMYKEVDGNITFIAPYVEHPDRYTGGIRIIHTDWLKILVNAVARAKADIAAIEPAIRQKKN